MGSWNKTCGLSRLPIFSGEDVYVFFLTPNLYHDRCYATALWRPLLVNLEAKYNDYGGFEDYPDDFVSGGILETLKKNIQPMAQGSNVYHDIAVTPDDDMTLEDIQEAIHEGRLFLKVNGQTTVPSNVSDLNPVNIIDSVFLRKDVVDHIINNYQYDRYVGQDKGTHGWGNSYVIGSFKECIDIIPKFAELLWDTLNAKDAVGVYRSASLDFLHSDPEMKMLHWHVTDSNYRFLQFFDPFWVCRELVASGTVTKEEFIEVAVSLYTSHVRGSLINTFMEMTRGVWAPGCHEGSQSDCYKEYRLLMEAMTQVIVKHEIPENDD